uniref:Slc32a-2 n=1 Tax=Schmidtea mediterranea TaxID=79327 RepID=A0A0H3YF91_SCHMD|nr:slc32a-2 [Schmidtea mediterranea]
MNNIKSSEHKDSISHHGKSKSMNESLSEIFVVKRSSSAIAAGWNITNIIQGIGILGIPFAMLKGSWIGIFMNIFSAVICCSTGKMIINCLYERVSVLDVNIKIHEDYSDIGEKVWPKFGRKFVTLISIIEMFGASTLYVILLGSSSYTLFMNIFPTISEQHWFIICCCLVLALLFIKQMSFISWFSLLAVIGLSGTIISIIVYCLTKYHDIKLKNIPRISIQDLPISMGIIVFSYCAHPLMPAIEASMKKPGQFNKMLNVTFTISLISKLIFGLIPVLIFGRNTLQMITNNFSRNDQAFYVVTHTFVLINVFFSMPLVIFILSQNIDEILLVNHFHPIFWPHGHLHFAWMLMSRLIILLTILLTGLVVPYFALVMSFIGSFTGTCLTFIFPCWFSLVLKRKELNVKQKLYRVSIIICGIFFGITGMIFAAKEMLKISMS